MAIIFHITTHPEWEVAMKKGYYETSSLKEEGFIHCCLAEQITAILDRYFQGKRNLVKLKIETGRLTSPFYYEWSPSVEETFPHIYGIINLDAVKDVESIG